MYIAFLFFYSVVGNAYFSQLLVHGFPVTSIQQCGAKC